MWWTSLWILLLDIVNTTLTSKRISSLVRDIPYDDYIGRLHDPFGRGVGRSPPKPRCLLSTITKLNLVTVTLLVILYSFDILE